MLCSSQLAGRLCLRAYSASSSKAAGLSATMTRGLWAPLASAVCGMSFLPPLEAASEGAGLCALRAMSDILPFPLVLSLVQLYTTGHAEVCQNCQESELTC